MRIARVLIAFFIYFLLTPADFAQGFGKAVNDGAGDYAGELARFHGSSVGNLLKKPDARGYFQKALYDPAIADFTKAINLDGVNADDYFAMTYRALAYLRKGALDAALADLNQALGFGVQQDHAYFVRGIVYKTKGDFAHARADFEAALQINPNNQPAKKALAALGQ